MSSTIDYESPWIYTFGISNSHFISSPSSVSSTQPFPLLIEISGSSGEGVGVVGYSFFFSS